MTETSGSGDPIHRHTEDASDAESMGDGRLVEAIVAHVTRHLGAPVDVWHPTEPRWAHVDVHVVPPSEDRAFMTLVTSGMSERPMAVPDGDDTLAYGELTLTLPADWPIDTEQGRWPVQLLGFLGELPHRFETWLWTGHTVPNGDPPEPYTANTGLCGAILAPALLVPEDFAVLEHDGRRIHFHGVVLLHAAEMRLKLDRGADALFDLLDRAEVAEGVDVARPSVVRERRGLFGRRRAS